MDALTNPVNPVELLSPAERGAYEKFLRSGKAPLGPDLAGRLFESFLNGSSLADIHKAHSELNFGAIVAARIEYEWDAIRADHMRKLMMQASDRIVRAQLEAVDFVFDLFNITHIVNKEKFAKFRASRNPEDLAGALKVESIKQYADLVRALTTLAERAPALTDLANRTTPAEAPAVQTTSTPAALPEKSSFLERAAAQRREEQAQQARENAVNAKKRPEDEV
jgi:hypothetical protein